MDLSVIVPVYNEEQSLPQLVEEIHAALRPGRSYEVILVDDGSTDRSFDVLRELAAGDPALTVIRLRRNFGQTHAMQAGLDAARGDVIALLDADLQNDPADIPTMIERLGEGHDLVAGWRADRKDRFFSRRLPSVVANRVISRVTGVRLHDYGCTLKVMTREVAKDLRLYGEMHRFIPAIADWSGARVLEVVVNHRARKYGVSKYGIGRTVRVILDLMVVRFLQAWLVKPMQIFGLWGVITGAIGFFICAGLAIQKLAYGTALAGRPLLLLGVLLMVVGVQLVSLGLVADLLHRTYHEAQGRKPYRVRTLLEGAGYIPTTGEAAQAQGEPDAAGPEARACNDA